jgi:hypothetical protein
MVKVYIFVVLVAFAALFFGGKHKFKGCYYNPTVSSDTPRIFINEINPIC